MKEITLDGNKQKTPIEVYQLFLRNLILARTLEIILMRYMTLWCLLMQKINQSLYCGIIVVFSRKSILKNLHSLSLC